MKSVKLTLAFWILAVVACSAQNLVFTSMRYEAPEFSALYPQADKDKPGVTYSSDNLQLKSGSTARMHHYSQSLHEDSDAFLVLYCDLPNTRSDAAALVNFGEEWTVRPSRELVERLGQIVGRDGVEIVYAPRTEG